MLNLKEVNTVSKEIFQKIFANVIEHYNEAAVSIESLRPFQDLKNLVDIFMKYIECLPIEEKVKILKLHPDLAGKLAQSSQLTQESTNEQKSAGLDQITSEERIIINHYNNIYKEKFGFPFIICARENKVKSIIEGLQRRYNNGREIEIENGIHEVKKICQFRILDIVKE